MNTLNNRLLSWVLGGILFFGALGHIDTDRRIVPAVEKLKVFYYDLAAQNQAVRHGTFDAIVMVYNNGGHGTGFFITNKVLLTNHHMVAKKTYFGGLSDQTHDEVTIQFKDGSQHQAKVVKSNPDMDIAMLEVIGDVEAPHTLSLAPQEPADGIRVYVAGNGGFDFWWAKGGYLRGTYKFDGLWKNTQAIAFMKSKGGFSGSPVISNETGQIVGVHAGGFTQRALAIHVPLSSIRKFIDQTPREANPYLNPKVEEKSKAEAFFIKGLFPETRGHTGNFRAYASHMANVDTNQVLGYVGTYGLRMELLDDGARFNGPRQAISHLLHHIYFGGPLEIEQEEKVLISRLYVPREALSEKMMDHIAIFSARNNVTFTFHERTNKMIFDGKKTALVAIADFVFREKPLI